MIGSLKDLEYECTNISAAALLAAYGLVGARMLVSSRSSSSSSTSPYTSSAKFVRKHSPIMSIAE